MPTESTILEYRTKGQKQAINAIKEIGEAARRSHRSVEKLQRELRGLGGGARGVTRRGTSSGSSRNDLDNQRTNVEKLGDQYKQLGRTGSRAINSLRKGSAAAAKALAAVRRAAAMVGRALRAAFRGARRSLRAFTRAMTAVPRAIIRTLSSPLGLVGGISGIIGAVLSFRKLINASDQWLRMQNRIAASSKQAANSTALLAKVQRSLFEIAQDSRSPLRELAELYGRLALGANRAIFSERDLLTITQTVAKAATIGGGTQESIRGALIQLSQIFGVSGEARGIGQELRSLREQAPVVFSTIAKGLNVTTSELEDMATQGQLTAAEVGQAFIGMSEEINKRFLRIQPTIAQAFTVLNNSVVRFIGKLSQASGAGRNFAEFIINLADKIEALTNKIAPLARALRAAFGGRGANLPYTPNPQLELPGTAAINRFVEDGSVTVAVGRAAETIGGRVRQQLQLLLRVFKQTIFGMAKGAGILLVEGIVFSFRNAIPILIALGQFIGKQIAVGVAKAFSAAGGMLASLFDSVVSKSNPSKDAKTLTEALDKFLESSKGLQKIQSNWLALKMTIGETAGILRVAGKQIREANLQGEFNMNTPPLEPESSFSKWYDAFKTRISLVAGNFKTLQQLGTQTGRVIGKALTEGISNTLVQVIVHAKNAGDAFRQMAGSILAELSRIILKFSIIKILSSTAFGGLLGFARGGVTNAGTVSQRFANGGLTRYAQGGVVNQPTVFPMARGGYGMIGEAGPEAYLPLGRDSDGTLGVRVIGSGSSQQQAVTVRSINVFSEADYEQLSSQRGFDEAIARMIGRGGPTAKAVRAASG